MRTFSQEVSWELRPSAEKAQVWRESAPGRGPAVHRPRGNSKGPRTEFSPRFKGIELWEAHVTRDGKRSDLGIRSLGQGVRPDVCFPVSRVGSRVPTAQGCCEACVNPKQLLISAKAIHSSHCKFLAQESFGPCFA